MKLRIYILLFLFGLPTGILHAQDSLIHHLQTIRIGYSYQTMRDDMVSALKYEGSSVFSGLTFQRESARNLHQVDFNFQYGIGRNDRTRDYYIKLEMVRGDLNYAFLHQFRMTDDTKWRFYAGASLHSTTVVRVHNAFSNNASNYDYFSSLQIAAAFRRYLVWKNRTMDWRAQFHLPVMALTVRPSIANSSPLPFLTTSDGDVKNFLNSLELKSWGGFRRFAFNSAFNFYLKNQNRLLLRYTWDIYQINSDNKVVNAFQAIEFGSVLHF